MLLVGSEVGSVPEFGGVWLYIYIFIARSDTYLISSVFLNTKLLYRSYIDDASSRLAIDFGNHTYSGIETGK